MAAPLRFIMIGGFLGAGKTTTIGRLAATYQQQGHKVGIVVNDQASDLVDTQSLRRQGFEVGEVAGACFCCNFNELTDTVAALEEQNHPDIVLAEPVGSCTDLVATVIQPLLRLCGEQFSVSPYGVILKPSHGRRILTDSEQGFSPKAAYIFKKQLEEADFVMINRIDELEADERECLQQLLTRQVPETPVLSVSAKTGEGFDAVLKMLDQQGPFGQKILDLDYDLYAEGEAELGWLNSSLRVTGGAPFSLDGLLLGIVSRLKETLARENAETAHLKVIGLWEGFYGVANLISGESPPELSLAAGCETTSADVILNARVASSPELLIELVEQAVEETCRSVGASAEFVRTQSFRPSRPQPTHRFDTALSEQ